MVTFFQGIFPGAGARAEVVKFGFQIQTEVPCFSA